jgi:cell shape-determining protein MreD
VIASRIALACASLISALLLQATLIAPLTFPVPVSLPALLVVVVGLYAGPGIGVGFGFATGLIADLGSDHPAGVLALCWLGGGLVAGRIGGLVTSRGSSVRIAAATAAVLATATGLTVSVILAVLGDGRAGPLQTLGWLVPVGLTDALLALLLVPLVRSTLRVHLIRPGRAEVILLDRPVGLGRNSATGIDVWVSAPPSSKERARAVR